MWRRFSRWSFDVSLVDERTLTSFGVVCECNEICWYDIWNWYSMYMFCCLFQLLASWPQNATEHKTNQHQQQEWEWEGENKPKLPPISLLCLKDHISACIWSPLVVFVEIENQDWSVDCATRTNDSSSCSRMFVKWTRHCHKWKQNERARAGAHHKCAQTICVTFKMCRQWITTREKM